MFSRRPDPRDEIIRDQRKQIADLLDRLQEMVGTVHTYQVAFHSQGLADQPKPFSISAEEASWKPEEEYDIEDLEEEGFIDADVVVDLLRSEGLLNKEFD